MDESLIVPIVERILQGQPKDSIRKEVLSFGYSEDEFQTAYTEATRRVSLDAPAPQSQERSVAQLTNSKKVTLIAVGVIVFLVIVGGGLLYFYLNLYHPNANGELASKNLHEQNSDIITIMEEDADTTISQSQKNATDTEFGVDLNVGSSPKEQDQPVQELPQGEAKTFVATIQHIVSSKDKVKCTYLETQTNQYANNKEQQHSGSVAVFGDSYRIDKRVVSEDELGIESHTAFNGRYFYYWLEDILVKPDGDVVISNVADANLQIDITQTQEKTLSRFTDSDFLLESSDKTDEYTFTCITLNEPSMTQPPSDIIFYKVQ